MKFLNDTITKTTTTTKFVFIIFCCALFPQSTSSSSIDKSGKFGCNLSKHICDSNEYCNVYGTILGKCEAIDELIQDYFDEIKVKRYENDDNLADIDSSLPILLHKYESGELNDNLLSLLVKRSGDEDDNDEEYARKPVNIKPGLTYDQFYDAYPYSLLDSQIKRKIADDYQDDDDDQEEDEQDAYLRFIFDNEFANINKEEDDDDGIEEPTRKIDYNDDDDDEDYDPYLPNNNDVTNKRLFKRNIVTLSKLTNKDKDDYKIDQILFDDDENNDIVGFKHFDYKSKPNRQKSNFEEFLQIGNVYEAQRQRDLFNKVISSGYQRSSDGDVEGLIEELVRNYDADENQRLIEDLVQQYETDDEVDKEKLIEELVKNYDAVYNQKLVNEIVKSHDAALNHRLVEEAVENHEKSNAADEDLVVGELVRSYENDADADADKNNDEVDVDAAAEIVKTLFDLDKIAEAGKIEMPEQEQKRKQGSDDDEASQLDEAANIHHVFNIIDSIVDDVLESNPHHKGIKTTEDVAKEDDGDDDDDLGNKNVISNNNHEQEKEKEIEKVLEFLDSQNVNNNGQITVDEQNDEDKNEKGDKDEEKVILKETEPLEPYITSLNTETVDDGSNKVDKKSDANAVVSDTNDSEKYMALDTNSAFTIKCNKSFINDAEARKLLNLLKISKDSIEKIIADGDSVTFTIKPFDSTLSYSVLEQKLTQNVAELRTEFGNDVYCDVDQFAFNRRAEQQQNEEDDKIKYVFIAILTICATIVTLLIALVGIFIVKRRNYAKYKTELTSKDGPLTDVISISTDSSMTKTVLNESSEKGKYGEWKSFWPFKKITASARSDEKPFAKQDYEELCRHRALKQQGNAGMSADDSLSTSSVITTTAVAVTSSIQQSRIPSITDTKRPSDSTRSSTSSWSEEPINTVNMDITTGHAILSYMEEHLNDKSRIEKDWESLTTYIPDICCQEAASQAENTSKNRYSNVLPYDHSRIVLKHVKETDYINASAITDHDPKNAAYIATQGPLPHTTCDFWQMVWEQQSLVIVCLSKTNESGSMKCNQYWPSSGCEVYDKFEVNLVSEHLWCEDYLVRSFYLKNMETNESRTVTQFHFQSWPENEVPQNLKSILDFRRKVNKSYKSKSCPIVVHCSDGIGRTGTYILIDMVLNKIVKNIKEINIAATLEFLRDQRPGMVANKTQFEFAFAVITEELQNMLKALAQ